VDEDFEHVAFHHFAESQAVATFDDTIGDAERQLAAGAVLLLRGKGMNEA
jgi:hypothetical protein